MAKISVLRGSVVYADTDAIVNAANAQLAGGSGVCGAIFTEAGWDDMQRACDRIGGCPTGQAKLTSGYHLQAKYVIHTPGPVWQGGTHGEAALLASCYRSVLTLAEAQGIGSVDFPCISTGVFGYPKAQAAVVALKAIMDFLREHDTPKTVRIICHSEGDADILRQTYNLWYAGTKDERL